MGRSSHSGDHEGASALHDATADDAEFCRAVGQAIQEHGLDGVTLDDIVRHSGIARTTLYRRHGGRDAVLGAFLRQRLAPDIAECRNIAMGPEPFEQRIERMIVYCVLAANRHAWLQRELARGLAPSNMDFISEAMRDAANQTLIPMLTQGRRDGICLCPAPLDELKRWLQVQIFELSRHSYATEAEAQRIVRTYIMPVLALQPARLALEDKLDVIYRHLTGGAHAEDHNDPRHPA